MLPNDSVKAEVSGNTKVVLVAMGTIQLAGQCVTVQAIWNVVGFNPQADLLWLIQAGYVHRGGGPLRLTLPGCIQVAEWL